ncbi:endothelin-converting enzyme 1 [Drosophila busckii]|uniref:endothelin-converting enzyme 1 n=1 Tax=Drosophila busckii TaxID=30019 RepID=UPI00083F0970|nr:endothelin-converting enzyme 1 [Drosophila busckii]XP_017845300.1 endothelin-converting enzyme 1 [Drosophila busckii]XP_017845301.1 endothelin-converting enzyme 1 [Drosophila busckii]XP_017845303.1 endothelin-converting enzyme 1 [Drosophila busckii]
MTTEFSSRNTFRKNGITGLSNNSRNVITSANPSGGSSAALLQKQLSFKTPIGSSQFVKPDEIEMIDCSNSENLAGRYNKNNIIGWICCAPCIWLRTSAAVHKMAITSATLLVTTLLVASPILFLISTAPSPLPRDCFMEGDTCLPTSSAPPECTEAICETVSANIQARLNWNKDPCSEFKKFSCWQSTTNQSNTNLIDMGSSQKSVDIQMQALLQNSSMNTNFRKLGDLFQSCLKLSLNSTAIQRIFYRLGGYLTIGTLGPSSIAPLVSKIYELGPSPLVDIYYDLSYGRRPHILLIISGPSTSSIILENKIRWMNPKAPPSRLRQGVPNLLLDLIDQFLPKGLSYAQKVSEKETIFEFIKELNKLQVEQSRRGFWDSSVLYNITSLQTMYPVLNWTLLIPKNWSGPIVVRNADYLRALQAFLTKYPSRVAHNSMLLLSTLEILPRDYPNVEVCTRSTIWALPDLASALYIAQHYSDDSKDIIKRADIIFKSLKAHLKRAPSLKGAALVKLSALKIQSQTWEGFTNITKILKTLDSLQINSDSWLENILEIYKKNKLVPSTLVNSESSLHNAWAYPIVSTIFYDTLSHSIVVPLSVMLIPYFNAKLPPYLHYASIGVSIAKEILRSITKTFDDKAMRCVPHSVNIFSNYSRMDILIHSGGMQISYHSMLSLTGPIKGMARLPGLNLTPTQIFFLVSAQELCAESKYMGIDTSASEFDNILGWLIAQGGSATEVFKCPSGSMINIQKTCNVL